MHNSISSIFLVTNFLGLNYDNLFQNMVKQIPNSSCVKIPTKFLFYFV